MKIDQLIRSRRKSIALIVDRDGRVVVRAPLRLPKSSIQAFVDEHTEWVQAKRAELAALPPNEQHAFVNGERFSFLGQTVRLELVEKRGARQPLRFIPAEKGQEAVFQLAQSAQPRARELLTSWYQIQAGFYCNERAAALAQQHGFEYTRLRISSARTRWGSCSSRGTLSFTWRLVMLPAEIIEYVILHELVHTVEHNHSPQFWGRLGALMPDYKARRAWLKKNGPLMVF